MFQKHCAVWSQNICTTQKVSAELAKVVRIINMEHQCYIGRVAIVMHLIYVSSQNGVKLNLVGNLVRVIKSVALL